MRRNVRGGRKERKIGNSSKPKINRFPKMMVLWYVVSEKIYNLPKDISMGRGYYTATVYAILKQISQRRREIEKKMNRKMTKEEKERFNRNLFEPDYDRIKFYNYIETPENPLHRYMWFRRGRNDKGGFGEVYVYIDGKDVPTIEKFTYQVQVKFGRKEIFEKYVKFVEEMIERNPEMKNKNYWVKKWFDDFWKRFRDENWDELYEKMMEEKNLKPNKEMKKKNQYNLWNVA